MIAKHPEGGGDHRLSDALHKFGRRRYAPVPDCQQPDAPADLPITHALQLTSIEARLMKLETQMTNQNRLLLIGILALVGELAKQVLKP
jgi:hypothetical protein